MLRCHFRMLYDTYLSLTLCQNCKSKPTFSLSSILALKSLIHSIRMVLVMNTFIKRFTDVSPIHSTEYLFYFSDTFLFRNPNFVLKVCHICCFPSQNKNSLNRNLRNQEFCERAKDFSKHILQKVLISHMDSHIYRQKASCSVLHALLHY